MASPRERSIPRVAILASGEGTTAEAYATAIHKNIVQHELTLLITDKSDAPVLRRATRWNKQWDFNVISEVVNREKYPDGPQARGQTTAEAQALKDLGERHRIDLFVCLGFLVIMNEPFVSAYGYNPKVHQSPLEARLLNTHPGPLPLTADTYGPKAARVALAAYKRGEITASAQTLHVVSAGVDQGPVVDTNNVPIERYDTDSLLFRRTQAIERQTIALGIDRFLRKQDEYLHPEAYPDDPYLRSPWAD